MRATAAVLLALSALPAAAAPLTGTFTSPLGAITISEKDGVVTGAVADAKNPCGFRKGQIVLNGTRLDDTCVAGTVTTCKLTSDTCHDIGGQLTGDAILLVTKGGALLSGTVHLDGKGCATLLKGDSLVLRKGAGKTNKPVIAPPPVAPKGKKDEAVKLAKEAQTLIGAGEAEEARKKCQQAVKFDPTFSQGYTCIAVSYYLRERYEEAFEQYALALEADPANRDVYYNMACIYAIQGKVEEALQYLKLSVLNGYIDLDTLNTDADLKNLHGNPDFEKLKSGHLE